MKGCRGSRGRSAVGRARHRGRRWLERRRRPASRGGRRERGVGSLGTPADAARRRGRPGGSSPVFPRHFDRRVHLNSHPSCQLARRTDYLSRTIGGAQASESKRFVGFSPCPRAALPPSAVGWAADGCGGRAISAVALPSPTSALPSYRTSPARLASIRAFGRCRWQCPWCRFRRVCQIRASASLRLAGGSQSGVLTEPERLSVLGVGVVFSAAGRLERAFD
jgi:hypothetical protein